MTDSAAPGASGSPLPDRSGQSASNSGAPKSESAQSASSSGGDPNSGPQNSGDQNGGDQGGQNANRNRRRRGSRGGRNRSKRPAGEGGNSADGQNSDGGAGNNDRNANAPTAGDSRSSREDPRPRIGDSRPAPDADSSSRGGNGGGADSGSGDGGQPGTGRKRRRRRRGRGGSGGSGGGGGGNNPVQAVISDDPVELDEATLKRRRGQERKGRPVGRYTMAVHVGADGVTQIAILEGRSLLEFYVSRPADDVSEIHGNVYLGKVQNVLPGMEAAFVDIGTPKNAVLYRGDVSFDKSDLERGKGPPRIEQMIKNRQTLLCQVTKNPIAHKGARLTQEVSLPGRFVVLVPNSDTYGISKRLPDKERKRLRQILDSAKPKQHGVIVRTAAENITAEEIERDVARLLKQWAGIEKLSNSANSPSLLYREPEMAMRVIREEFTKDYRSVIIDDQTLFTEVTDYVSSITPALSDRLQFHDDKQDLPLFERFHVHEQLVKALDRKVWLPSGGSLIIEHTEALTVIDVNTGKNVGKSSLEETVFRNNLEAAKEVARQLRLRDIGGIIVIDFVDMEERRNRDEVTKVFREALARDKTRTQVFEISDLGLVEMTRKRIGEGLLESFANACEHCDGLGHILDDALLTGQ